MKNFITIPFLVLCLSGSIFPMAFAEPDSSGWDQKWVDQFCPNIKNKHQFAIYDETTHQMSCEGSDYNPSGFNPKEKAEDYGELTPIIDGVKDFADNVKGNTVNVAPYLPADLGDARVYVGKHSETICPPGNLPGAKCEHIDRGQVDVIIPY